jgi:acyl-CoA synthetase (AMP-forming)/AMP-acid ligase II
VSGPAATGAPSFPDHEATVPALLAAGRERYGPLPCVATPAARLSFAELDVRSGRLAARLVRTGVVKGTRVGLLFPNGVDWVLAWAATARIGAVAVPVNTFYRPAELARLLRHADVQLLLGAPSMHHHDFVARLEEAAPGLASRPGAPMLLPSLPQLRRVLLQGPSRPAWAEAWPDDPGGAEPDLEDVVRAMAEDVTPADVALVTYTSGSTGEPKGVVHGHGPVVRHAANLATLTGIDATSRIWSPMPLCWVGGFVFGLLRALVCGACFVTQDVFEPGDALRLLERERVTDVAAWPGATRALLEHPDFGRTDLGALRSGFYEALPVDRRPPEAGLAVGSLGMSETCGPHTGRTADAARTGAPDGYRGTFGHAVPGTEHRIVDPATGLDLPEGQEGEVLVRGYSLMLGLHRRERADVFDADGWYHTGDRGFFRDGWFFFTGRQGDLIKAGGSNVAPGEVEQCLLQDGDLKLAFVVGVPDEVRGERVVALVVPWSVEPSAPDGEELRQRMRHRLASFKVPRRVLVIGDDQVPWLASQKVDRQALVALAQRLEA